MLRQIVCPVILVFSLLGFSFKALSQTTSPTLEETEQWIAEKIGTFGYGTTTGSLRIKYRYNVTYADKQMNVDCKIASDNPLVPKSKSFSIYLPDVQKIAFVERESNFWMNVYLKKNHSNLSRGNEPEGFPDGSFSFLLGKEFKQDELPNRMLRAFARLVELNGGTHFSMSEAY